MEKKFKLKKDGQPLSMPCTKEQWEALKPELDEIEGVDYDCFFHINRESFLANNIDGKFGVISNIHKIYLKNNSRINLPSHDKEAFLSSLRGEPIVKEEVKKPVTFNDEYWEKLYHECAVRLWASAKSGTSVKGAVKISKMLIEELKNNPLK